MYVAWPAVQMRKATLTSVQKLRAKPEERREAPKLNRAAVAPAAACSAFEAREPRGLVPRVSTDTRWRPQIRMGSAMRARTGTLSLGLKRLAPPTSSVAWRPTY